MHEHRLDLVGIAVEGGQVRVTLPDGAAQTGQPTRPGDVVFLRRGVIHVEESVADGGVSVAIELRDAPASARPADTSAPEAFPREGARLVLENDRAAIWDYQWVPGRAVARHVHTRDTVLVPIVAGEVRVQFRSGETRLSRLVPGEALFFSEAEAHREEASAGSPRAILVELK
jgi:quercetin dioxygenase-like cupin family protein